LREFSYKGLLGALLVGTTIVGAEAQEQPERSIALPLMEGLQRGAFFETYVAQVLRRLRQADRNRDGLDREDIKLADDQRRAQARASSISRILTFDLNGDLDVTREEMEAGARGREGLGERSATLFEQFDTDQDGVITLEEMTRGEPDQRTTNDTRLETLLALDPDGDGRLTVSELRKLAEDTFRKIDTNGDDEISEEEGEKVRQLLRVDRSQQKLGMDCKLPDVPTDAQVVVFGVLGADAISSAVIGNPDKETGLLDVVIEPGASPLYLFLTSQKSVIWQVTGATERIAQIVASSHELGPAQVSATGVIGVEEGKITIARSRCPRFNYRPPSDNPNWMRGAVRASTGRTPDVAVQAYRAQRVTLPSGTITHAAKEQSLAPPGFDPTLWASAARYWPAGIVDVDPSRVFSKVGLMPYPVLPGDMGLAQLVGSGAIEQTGPREFRQVKAIAQMPPDINPTRLLFWTVAKGVPVPLGQVGNLCLILEDANPVVAGRKNCLPR